jgi:uncharacterized coiled-coil DUF342 family protein
MDPVLYRQKRAALVKKINHYIALRDKARSEANACQDKINRLNDEIRRLNTYNYVL